MDEIRKLVQVINLRLTDLKVEIQKGCNGQTSPLDDLIEAARPVDDKKEYIIALLGLTGAGKSSFLNALLGVRYVTEVSGMGSCTSVPIEHAYNTCPDYAYRATVQFRSPKAWLDEVSTFLNFFKNTSEQDLADEDSEAATSFARISAVFRGLDRSTLANLSFEELVNPTDLAMLGTTLEIKASTEAELATELNKYIGRKERLSTSPDEQESTSGHGSHEQEYWPLVKQVRVYLRAEVLKPGLIVTDLPGVGDINHGRVAIVREYIPKCSHLWIIAPIERASDSKVAQNLLSDSLGHQLRRDGLLDRVSFICTKTDLCVKDELKTQFKDDQTFQSSLAKITTRKKEVQKLRMQVSGNHKKAEKLWTDTSDKIEALESELEIYKKLLAMHKAGQVVHPPILPRRKRRLSDDESTARKNSRFDAQSLFTATTTSAETADDVQASGQVVMVENQDCEVENVEQDVTQAPLEITALQLRLYQIENSLNELSRELAKHDKTSRGEKGKLDKLDQQFSDITKIEGYACCEARNAWVTKRLKERFVAEIRELEKAEAQAGDRMSQDAIEEQDCEMQLDLPVFCVSSQGYQRLSARFEDENISDNFTDIKQTGVPAIQEYCITSIEQTIKSRRAAFVTSVSRLLTSVEIFLSRKDNIKSDSVQVVLPSGTQEMRDSTEAYIKETENIFGEASIKIDTAFKDVIKTLRSAALVGEASALNIVRSWGPNLVASPIGLQCKTYQAVLRHGGRYRNPKGYYNWFDELLKPMMRKLDAVWIYTFERIVPNALSHIAQEYLGLTRNYLGNLTENNDFLNASPHDREMFRLQVERHVPMVQAMLTKAYERVHGNRSLANRRFLENAESLLLPLFRELGTWSGTGVMTEIKQRMEQQMNNDKGQLYSDSADKVTRMLVPCREICGDDMLDALKESFAGLRQDLDSIFPEHTTYGDQLGSFEQQTRVNISQAHKVNILNIIREFRALLDIEPDTVDIDSDKSPKVEDDMFF